MRAVAIIAKKRDNQELIGYGVGIVFHAKVGGRLNQGDPLFTGHASHQDKLKSATQRFLAAISWSNSPVKIPHHTIKIIE